MGVGATSELGISEPVAGGGDVSPRGPSEAPSVRLRWTPRGRLSCTYQLSLPRCLVTFPSEAVTWLWHTPVDPEGRRHEAAPLEQKPALLGPLLVAGTGSAPPLPLPVTRRSAAPSLLPQSRNPILLCPPPASRSAVWSTSLPQINVVVLGVIHRSNPFFY